MAALMTGDPVLERRARLSRLAVAGKRAGYGFLLVSIVAFFYGLAEGYEVAGPVVIISMAVCTVVLAPAMVLGYAVGAAEREDKRPGPTGR
jgi:hypothetical protein